jgi:DNA-binding transcriptional regulator GbsR (MarR family)
MPNVPGSDSGHPRIPPFQVEAEAPEAPQKTGVKKKASSVMKSIGSKFSGLYDSAHGKVKETKSLAGRIKSKVTGEANIEQIKEAAGILIKDILISIKSLKDLFSTDKRLAEVNKSLDAVQKIVENTHSFTKDNSKSYIKQIQEQIKSLTDFNNEHMTILIEQMKGLSEVVGEIKDYFQDKVGGLVEGIKGTGGIQSSQETRTGDETDSEYRRRIS